MKEILYQLRWGIPYWFVQLILSWVPETRYSLRLRGALARPFIGRCGARFLLGKGVTIVGASQLEIGEDVYIARDAWLNASAGITLGDEVTIAPFVVIATMNYGIVDGRVSRKSLIGKPVTVGAGTWIGAHATLAAGASVGEGCVVGANALVAHKFADRSMIGGVPATRIGDVSSKQGQSGKLVDFLAQSRNDSD